MTEGDGIVDDLELFDHPLGDRFSRFPRLECHHAREAGHLPLGQIVPRVGGEALGSYSKSIVALGIGLFGVLAYRIENPA